LEIKKSVSRDFKSIPKKLTQIILNHIESLSENPRPYGVVKLKDSIKSYRIRVADYRIVYQIDDDAKKVIVFGIGHIKDIYRKF
jgi:mRNA interferase RelE/StbE